MPKNIYTRMAKRFTRKVKAYFEDMCYSLDLEVDLQNVI